MDPLLAFGLITVVFLCLSCWSGCRTRRRFARAERDAQMSFSVKQLRAKNHAEARAKYKGLAYAAYLFGRLQGRVIWQVMRFREWWRGRHPSVRRQRRRAERDAGDALEARCAARAEREAAALEARKERYREDLKRVRPALAPVERWLIFDERRQLAFLYSFDTRGEAEVYMRHLRWVGLKDLHIEKA